LTPLTLFENSIDRLPNLNLVETQYCPSRNVTHEEDALTLEVLEEFKWNLEEEEDVQVDYDTLHHAGYGVTCLGADVCCPDLKLLRGWY
jgi:hypothetical protein